MSASPWEPILVHADGPVAVVLLPAGAPWPAAAVAAHYPVLVEVADLAEAQAAVAADEPSTFVMVHCLLGDGGSPIWAGAGTPLTGMLTPAGLVARPAAVIAGARILITGDVSDALAAGLAAAGATVTTGAGPADAQGVIMLDALAGSAEPEALETVRRTVESGARWVLAAGRPGGRTDVLADLFRTVAQDHPGVTARYLAIGEGIDVAAAVLRELAGTTAVGTLS